MTRLIDRLALKNEDWIRVVCSFGAPRHEAQDVVQNMYIKMHEWESKGKNSILYNKNEVNYYFVFKVLRTLFLDEKRATKNYFLTNSSKLFEHSNAEEMAIQNLTEDIKQRIEGLHWYDKRVFNIVCIQKISMLQLSQQTGISYHSIKRTIKKVKELLK